MVPMRVPDVFLEKLLCDVCSKFLSVQPVKVCPGKKVKCGRCSNNDPDGVVSLYGLIANQFCFPCVNRYDGCNESLTLSQVAAHEKKCQSKCCVCPICGDNEEIPTFLMMKHFRDMHREAFLETQQNFSIDMKESLQTKWFLYKLKNKLFFIKCSLNGPDNTVLLDATCIGVTSMLEEITQKFLVYCGSTTTEKRMCLPHHHRKGNMGLRVNISDLNHGDLVMVTFQIDICRNILISKMPVIKLAQDCTTLVPTRPALLPSSNSVVRRNIRKNALLLESEGNFCRNILISKMPVIKPAQDCTTLVPTQPALLPSSNPVVRRNRRKNALLLESEGNFSELDFIRVRSIFLYANLRSKFAVDPTAHFCIYKGKNLFLRCFKCCEYEYSIGPSTSGSHVNMYYIRNEAYPLCVPCSKIIAFDRENWFLSSSHFRMMRLFCIFCDSVVPLDNIFQHEATCSQQPLRLCPLESCSMKGKVIDIEIHFKQHSPEYHFSFKSIVKLNLVPSKSPIKQFLMARNAFVFVELKWNKPLWHVEISLCGAKDTFAELKLKAILIDVATEKFLGYVEQHQVKELYRIETVLIKCFLEI